MREEERHRENEVFHPLIDSPIVSNGWGWVRPQSQKPGTPLKWPVPSAGPGRILASGAPSIWVSHIDSGAQLSGPSATDLPGALARSGIRSRFTGTLFRIPIWDASVTGMVFLAVFMCGLLGSDIYHLHILGTVSIPRTHVITNSEILLGTVS